MLSRKTPGIFAKYVAIRKCVDSGAPFSDAIVDPLVLHHAHIENEERLNLFMLNRVRDVELAGRQGYISEFELAYALPNHRYGFEVFIPVANLPARQGSGRVTAFRTYWYVHPTITIRSHSFPASHFGTFIRVCSSAWESRRPLVGSSKRAQSFLLQVGNHLKWRRVAVGLAGIPQFMPPYIMLV